MFPDFIKSRIPEEIRIRYFRRHRAGIQLHGWRRYAFCEWCRLRFEARILDFSSLNTLPLEESTIYLLSGSRHASMTRLMVHSLFSHSRLRWPLKIFSDGSLDAETFSRHFGDIPSASFATPEEVRDRHQTHLPESKYPFLHKARNTYVHNIKLVDAFPGESGYATNIDSDIIFLSRPDEWIELARNETLCIQVEKDSTHYNLPYQTLRDRIDAPLLPRLCAGWAAYRMEWIDWDFLEYVMRNIWDCSDEPVLTEMTLAAYILSPHSPTPLDPDLYFAAISPGEAAENRRHHHPVSIHYAHQSRADYYPDAWQYVSSLS